MKNSLLLAALLLCLACAGLAEDKPTDSGKGIDLFRQTVRPLIVGKCLTCHTTEQLKGGLDLTSRSALIKGGDSGPAIVVRQGQQSLLLRKVQMGEMPPKNPLTAEQAQAFQAWIDAGAPYEDEPIRRNRAGLDWWSLRRIQRPQPPKVKNANWPRAPLDQFILAQLEAHGLQPNPETERATYIRRVTFALLGLPPTPEETEAFVTDAAPDAHERLVDRLLASPHYGERWGRHWLDVVRFGESHGYETNQLRMNAWPYRDYVIRAFNQDTPLPQFVMEQLAGDRLANGDWLTQAATSFLVGGVHDVVGNQTREGMLQQRMDDLDDMITAMGTGFLGLTANCARCHDHKFDPITQKDYYGLQAIFAGVQHTERDIPTPDAEHRQRERRELTAELAQVEQRLDELVPLARNASAGSPSRPAVNARRNVERLTPVPARFIRFQVLATNNLEPCLDELEVFSPEQPARNVALASLGTKATASSEYPNASIHKIAHINDGKHGNSWSWISHETGKGWVQIELPTVTTIDRIVWGRDREEKFKDRLPTEYWIEVAVEPNVWRTVASSADRAPIGQPLGGLANDPERSRLLDRQKVIRERLPALAPTLKAYAGSFAAPGTTTILKRGDPLQPGDAVQPSAIAAIHPPLVLDAKLPEQERRLALARWIGHPENPLPARVMVNRLWHYHFGQGLVTTPSDLGFQGGKPSHPELLDWLASEYIANGWQLKPIHRLIVLSATYRQTSRANDTAMSRDRQNRWLWRMHPRRLEAEAIRDAILSISGQLDRHMGGPGYNIWEPNTNYVTVFKPKAELGSDELRRMVYQFKPRTQQDPTFGAFDCPDAALVAPRRNASTTALQALNLLNSPFIVAQAEAFAKRLQAEAGADPTQQAQLAFRLAFGRAPSEREQAASVELIRNHGTAAFCRALYNANELVYVE